MRVQDPATGLWYQVLDQGGRAHNYLESSGSAMFSYFLLKMARTGYVDSVPDKEAGLRGFEGLLTHKVCEGEGGEIHLTDICRGAGPLLSAALEAEHPQALANSPVGTAW